MQAVSLGYHDVSGGAQPIRSAREGSVYTLSAELFASHMREIGAATAVGQVSSIKRRPGNSATLPVYLTFDDGALCAHSLIMDALDKAGYTGHFFIVTDWIGMPGFMDVRRIRELHQRGHIIGSHSRTHPDRMSSLRFEDLLREWTESCQTLSNVVGEPVTTASVAGGYYSRKVGRAAAAAGIGTLFTSEPTIAVTKVDTCTVLGRYSVRRSTPAHVVASIVRGEKLPRYEQSVAWLLKKGAKLVTGRWFVDIRRMLLASGGF